METVQRAGIIRQGGKGAKNLFLHTFILHQAGKFLLSAQELCTILLGRRMKALLRAHPTRDETARKEG